MLRYSEHFPGAGDAMLQAARETGVEGLMAKRANSRYESRRSSEWIKIKIVERQEFVICGFTAGERDHFGALVLGVYDNGKLTLGGQRRHRLRPESARLPAPEARSAGRRRTRPFRMRPKVGKDVTWVKPELVAEVKFANWTGEGRLRAPVYLGLRPDVDPARLRPRDGRDRPPAVSKEALLPPADE